MKRLSLNRLKKEFCKAKMMMDHYYNDLEIEVYGRGVGYLWTTSPEEAFEHWKEEEPKVFKYISIKIQNMEDSEINNVLHVFEHEQGEEI